MDLAVLSYEFPRMFPESERFGLTSQLQRAATSVPANIAEGKGRSTARDYANFLGIARGSLFEADTFIELAWRIGYIPDADARTALALSDEIRRMLTALRNRVMEEGRNGKMRQSNPSNLEPQTSNLED
jgi:four helix bundle protein